MFIFSFCLSAKLRTIGCFHCPTANFDCDPKRWCYRLIAIPSGFAHLLLCCPCFFCSAEREEEFEFECSRLIAKQCSFSLPQHDVPIFAWPGNSDSPSLIFRCPCCFFLCSLALALAVSLRNRRQTSNQVIVCLWRWPEPTKERDHAMACHRFHFSNGNWMTTFWQWLALGSCRYLAAGTGPFMRLASGPGTVSALRLHRNLVFSVCLSHSDCLSLFASIIDSQSVSLCLFSSFLTFLIVSASFLSLP